ncbi:MAG: DotA/TraY family protein [Alphaproteobacteria bacterium]|jgi:hypothetical protein|nr:DotA/TraY family protein [Alphaproteobacteria bacterium]MCB9985537.1 DotA/TraY family protein [Micavibrio sp.]HPQ50251.1 DotA/TraY family protein [Alphaproteobacteria bacterium]
MGLGEAVQVTTGKALGYSLLPGIFPRIGSLLFSGFGPIPYLLALLCLRMRLLPKGHPFFHTRKTYGIRHVLAESARHLEFKWRNIDQIIVFGALLCGSTIVLAFIAAIIVYLVFSSSAFAAVWIPDIFNTANPDHDVAFMMMDRVLGIPGIYDSAIITDPATYGPSPNIFQNGLHAMLEFFSWGLFVIAVFIFLYFVIEIVWDVTQTGSPLGETLTNTWIPLRLIMAFGLLVPIPSYGLNSAQYITLYTAKMGSGMATNAWGAFNMATGTNPTGMSNEQLIGVLGYQDLSGLLKGLMVMKSCERINFWGSLMSATSGLSGMGDGTDGSYYLLPYIINGQQAISLNDIISSVGGTYNASPVGVVTGDPTDVFGQVLSHSDSAGIRLVLGYMNTSDPTMYKDFPGGVLPVCGEVYIPVSGYNPESLLASEAYFYAVLYTLFDQVRNSATLSTMEINSSLAVIREYIRTSSDYENYIQIIRNIKGDDRDCLNDDNGDGYESYDEAQDDGKNMGKCTEPIPAQYWNDYLAMASTLFLYDPYNVAHAALTDVPNPVDMYSIGDTTYSSMGFADPMMLDVAMVELGWGGAGMWYNRISEKNGSFVSAVSAIPVIQKMPMAMEKLKEDRGKNDAGMNSGFCSQYSPGKSGSTSSNIADEKAQFTAELAHNLHKICQNLYENEHIQLEVRDSSNNLVFKPNDQKYANPVEHAMAMVFAEFKMFDIRANDETLPMAQLSAVGRVLVDKSILAMMAAMGSSAIGGLLHAAAGSADGKDIAALNTLGEAFGEASTASLTFASLGLTAGVLLHYVLPFLPFMYFFFAVGRWVKTVFEALIGVPLWALAHLRLSGPGLPGEAASSGYFLLLEIFIRPILTVFSLVASFAVFTAMVIVLNSIFDLLVTNFGGADVPFASTDATILDNARGVADQFFYSIMYIVLCYMIATSSFKLIDVIPDNILSRWSGAGVSTIGASDNADDLIDQLQTQLPVMINYYAKSLGKGVTDALYEPGRDIGQQAEVKYNQEQALKAQQEAAKKAGGNNPPQGQSSAPPPSSSSTPPVPPSSGTGSSSGSSSGSGKATPSPKGTGQPNDPTKPSGGKKS